MAVQVVIFVADGPGHKALGLQRKGLAVPVIGLNGHLLRAHHQAILAGGRKTPLQAVLLAALGGNGGIDELRQPLADIHHKDPAQHAYLYPGNAHAVGLVHGIGHVVQQRPQPLIKFFHRAAYLAQPRLFFGHNISQCHCSTSLD